MASKSKWEHVTPESIRHALCIDFEGQKEKPPVLLGCATRKSSQTWQYITDPTFRPLAIGGLEQLTLSAAVERILGKAAKGNRQIIAWSEHELNVVKTHCPEQLERFQNRFVNALAYAKYWRNKCHNRDKPEPATLASYLALIGHVVPDEAVGGTVGKTIGIVRKALEKGLGVDGMTENQLRRWKFLREHNHHDCVGMRKVCLMAAAELAEKSQSKAGSPKRRRQE